MLCQYVSVCKDTLKGGKGKGLPRVFLLFPGRRRGMTRFGGGVGSAWRLRQRRLGGWPACVAGLCGWLLRRALCGGGGVSCPLGGCGHGAASHVRPRGTACSALLNGPSGATIRAVQPLNTGRFAACAVTRCATVSCLPPCLACACALASRCQGRQAWLLQSGRMPGACSADAARRGAAAATLYYYKAAHCNTNETHI